MKTHAPTSIVALRFLRRSMLDVGCWTFARILPLTPALVPLLLLAALPALAALPPSSGGPDSFGYRYTDSRPTTNNLPPSASSHFGGAVDLSGSLMAVGAPFDPSQNLRQSGNVYLFDLDSATPTDPVATLNNPTPGKDDFFGDAISVSGTRVVVGSPQDDTSTTNAGIAYVYDLASPTPTMPVATLYNPLPGVDDRFGQAVSISGTLVVVGADGDDTDAANAGAAYLYDLASTNPINPVAVLLNPTPAANDAFGRGVSISGMRVAIGASGDGTGAPLSGSAYVYDLTNASPEVAVFTLNNPSPFLGDFFGRNVSISGDRVVVAAHADNTGGDDSGSAYVYDLADPTPTVPVATLHNPSPAPDDKFGESVSISGSRLVVGANGDESGAGRAYLYDLMGATPTNPVATLLNPTPSANDYFGTAVGISGTRVAVGASSEDLGAVDSGAVYEYSFPSDSLLRTFPPPGVFPATPALNFTDLVPLGAPQATGITGDDTTQALDIGFPFVFYDQEHSICYPSSNGLLAFGKGNSSYSPTALPNGASGAVRNFIAPFWADLQLGASSKVYYMTIGNAPRRVFIVQYQDVEQFLQPTKKLTFQVKLFEGSNAIEFQYQSIDDFVASGNDRTIGIEDSTGLIGLQYSHGPVGSESTELPATPFAVRIERPVFVEVESTYVAPDTSTRSIALGGKLRPHAGRFAVPYESVQRFEAPQFVYLNKDLVELDGIGDLNDPDPDKVAYYRVKNVGYAIDGENVQGVDLFFERTVTRNIKVIWRWEVEYAVIIDSATGDSGLGNPDPGVGRSWITKDTQFSAAIDTIVQDDAAGLRLRHTGYAVTTYPIDAPSSTATTDVHAAGSRLVTSAVDVSEPLRIQWQSTGEVRYRFDAVTASGAGTRQLNGEPFVRVYEAIGTNFATYFGPTTNAIGAGPNIDVWIPIGRKADVGCFYRTADRCLTLTGPTPDTKDEFTANPVGDLPSDLKLSTLVDTDVQDFTNQTRAARIHSVSNVTTASEIHWLFGPTVFRAEIPLGQGLDAVTPDVSLVPQLCGSAPVLRTGATGPGGPFIGPKPDLADPGLPEGDAAAWDRVGKVLLPVQPGSYTVAWPDANLADTEYSIELVSGFPGESVPLSSPREDLYGRRLTTNVFVSTKTTPAALDGYGQAVTNGAGQALYYLTTTVLDPVDDSYPGAPVAHYRHLYDVEAERRPPTKLDISATDRWWFKQKTFVETGVGAQIDAGDGKNFQTEGPGRSVLLYSYRPNADEVATGDPVKERLAVRVVNSAAIAPVQPTTTALGTRALHAGSGDLGLVRSGGAPTSLAPGKDFSVDFWVDMGNASSNVVLVDLGRVPLTVTVDPAAQTIRADYFNINITRALPANGTDWRHIIVHVFESVVGGFIKRTSLTMYIDGDPEENAMLNGPAEIPGSPPTIAIETTVQTNGLQLAAGAEAAEGVRFDRLRLHTYSNIPVAAEARLTFSAREYLRTGQGPAPVSGPSLSFGFETAPVGTIFTNEGSEAGVGIGIVSGDPREPVNLQEVATRVQSVLDKARFGSGYILNELSNYNAELYQRDAEVGAWGPVYPVNNGLLFTGENALEVAYYENPYLNYPGSSEHLHPNVAWPYAALELPSVDYPAEGPHKSKRIYIASRIGSEGVDANGSVQAIFDLARYANFAIYNQPDRTIAGFNPNDEHALAAGSYRASLKVKNLGEALANNPPLAAFALQKHVNDLSIDPDLYTSHPWVLIQVDNLASGIPEMAAYKVELTRAGTVPFPRPLDSELTPGLAYESAANPDDRFLTMDPAVAHDFAYEFEYPAYAGDLLIPPYPLNLVIGNVTMLDERGGNIQVGGVNQRTFWKDVNNHAWVVSGGGRFFNQFFYPFRGDFHLPGAVSAGTPVAWLPSNGAGQFVDGDADALNPVPVYYNSSWRSGYPKLKRGETLTYQGGEYFNENPGSDGLPALVAMRAAEVVFDSVIPDMIDRNKLLNDYSARVIRPLDRHEVAFTVAQMGSAGFTPAATEKVAIVAERWYFKDLAGSLQRRFYYDSLAERLVFRGYLNDKDSGDADLTAGPDPLNILEPNILTLDEYADLVALSPASPAWVAAADDIFVGTQNPHGVSGETVNVTSRKFLAGVKDTPTNHPAELQAYWLSPGVPAAAAAPTIVHLDSFGVGSALVPNPKLLTQDASGSLYVTIAENNRSDLDGAPVSLHIVEIIPDRYRGAIKVIEGADAFSEKISLQHNGEFGANTDDLYYEWWIRDAASLDVVALEVLTNGTLTETDGEGNSLWQEYVPEKRALIADPIVQHAGLHSIVFEGRPDVVLVDKLVLMRYRHKTETSWTLVPLDTTQPAAVAWQPGSPAPFQWAGAANSPQLQADGSKRYIPQLVMGWIKRILDRINPYEARYTDFFGNESPATYSSQIQIAGPPFAGAVALNPDKNVIENVGLIELYETVLARAKALSIDNLTNPVGTAGINQALLLAATRLTVLYELLAREAYSDAQDSTIRLSGDDALNEAVSFTHAFQNQEANLLHEELALLRGTDFRKSYPVYNRMMWNYVKGLGEAAYNVNYNIYDENTDGFINEDDGRALYPQGHGDSWGHFVSAMAMHYELLRHPVFSWQARSELYSLMQNVIEADFLDETTFARLAAAKARAGRDIVRGTYRLHYTQEPDGQWQGYTDGADPARAWGVSEWAHRAGQGAYFDWAVANALLPEDAPPLTTNSPAENLDHLDRLAAEDEIVEVAGALFEVQQAMDEANNGQNPLGFDADALTFDIDPYYDGIGWERATHFEQVYERAVVAGANARQTLDFAVYADNKLRRIASDTDTLIVDAFRQDADYRSRLIEIFGRPYGGTIGFGKVYPEGYEGPDTLLFAYLDHTTITQIIPENEANASASMVSYASLSTEATSLADNSDLRLLYADVLGNWAENAGTAVASPFGLTFGVGSEELTSVFLPLVASSDYHDFTENVINSQLPVRKRSPYAFQSGADWGTRTSYGKLQRILEQDLRERIALDSTIQQYVGFLQDFEVLTQRLETEIKLMARRGRIAIETKHTKALLENVQKAQLAMKETAEVAADTAKNAGDGGAEALPTSVGFSTDAAAPGRGGIKLASGGTRFGSLVTRKLATLALAAAEFTAKKVLTDLATEKDRTEDVRELEAILIQLVSTSGNEAPLRDAIGIHEQNLEILRQEYVTAQAEGFRLLSEREAYNKVLAASVQKNRYADMVLRLSRNEAMTKYQSAFNHAARYAWLATRAYDYETSLDPGDPAAPGALLDDIVKERQLGQWVDGQPQIGQGGLAETLATLNGNYQVLEGQLGINNPQAETEKISLRQELFRILPATTNSFESDRRWKEALLARKVDNLSDVPEFLRYCRPFADPADGAQPGLVIRFATHIEPGFNVFGNSLAGGDHSYSLANFATKIRGFGVWMDGYNDANLATTPRAYLVPVGNDYMRVSTTDVPTTRIWGVQEQRIPTPFVINPGDITAPDFIPSLDGVDGVFSSLRRHGDFRIYHNAGETVDESEMIYDSRLISRSVWNSEWLLIIPGVNLDADPDSGVDALAESITDIKLFFKTYSHQGL